MSKLKDAFDITRRSYDLVTLYNLFNEIHELNNSNNKNSHKTQTYKMHSPEWVIGKLASYIHINNPDQDIIESVEAVIENLRRLKAGKLPGIKDPVLVVPSIDWDTLWDEDEEAA